MKWQAAVAMGLICAGCATQPQTYAEGLGTTDPKWQSAACKAMRQRAGGYEQAESDRFKSEFLMHAISPSGTLATINVTNQRNVWRRQASRDVHLACSSRPLPEELTNIPEIQPPSMLDTGRGN